MFRKEPATATPRTYDTAPALDPSVPPCVQQRLARSAGVSPAGVRARSPVAWMAGRRETDALKPIDTAIPGMVGEVPGRNESERTGDPESYAIRQAESAVGGRR